MIKLPEGYGIKTDKRNYILGEVTMVNDEKNGGQKESLENLRYFLTMSSLINYFIHIALRKKVSSDKIIYLEQYLLEQKELIKKVEQIFKDYPKSTDWRKLKR